MQRGSEGQAVAFLAGACSAAAICVALMANSRRRGRRAAAVCRDGHLSTRMQRLPSNPFLPLIPLMKNPENAMLASGVPPFSIFPLRGLQATLKDGSQIVLNDTEVISSQRYAAFAQAEIKAWCQELTQRLHAPPSTSDLTVTLAAGSMSSVEIAFQILLDPNSDDVVLVEEHSFTAALDSIQSLGVTVIPVALDSEGLDPRALRAVVDRLRAVGRRPRALYSIPVGQNPTGTRLAAKRYRQIYKIAQDHDFVIIEDDAYFFQQHRASACTGTPESTPVPGDSGLGPSFLSIDDDGRVLRLDSFSKLLAPGFRLGWVSGPRHLVEAYDALAYCSSQSGASLSMVLLGKALRSMGEAGFRSHVVELQDMLRLNCVSLCSALEMHFGDTDIARWDVPSAGMFLWLRTNFDLPDDATLAAAMEKHRVVVLPGSVCAPLGALDRAAEVMGSRSFIPMALGQRRSLRLSYVIDPALYDDAVLRLRAMLEDLKESSRT